MTDGQSTNLSWCQAPILGPRSYFYQCQTVAGLLIWGALSDERTYLAITIAAGLRQHRLFRVRVIHDLILLSQIPDSPNLEGHIPVFISPRNRVAQF
jgi:hypothetical protein